MDDNLYRRALTEPLLRCVWPEEAKLAMNEVHSGVCAEHMAGKNLALKIMRYGVFWHNESQIFNDIQSNDLCHALSSCGE